ncbi:MAG: hypothetical protein HY925_05305 [Elusimicrobia bacterium]|nr:hypothetical protein [Elusimicrobiota bacterium]
MSFTGQIDAKCPGCSESGDFEIWSFVRGDLDETLRERIKGGELNVLECPNCGRLFYPETSWVYAEPPKDLLAFVFPEGYREEADKWRAKMREDFEKMRPVTEKLGLHEEPLVFFGAEPLAMLLHETEALEDEAEVAHYFCEKLGLTHRLVGAAFARARRLPRSLVQAKGPYSRERAVEGLKKLVAENDRLEGYRRWLQYLSSDGPEPPFVGK